MLSRRKSDSSSRLRRTQSTSSARVTAFLHAGPRETTPSTHAGAVAAANLAYEQARELRKSDEQQETNFRKRSKRSSIGPGICGQGSHLSRVNSQGRSTISHAGNQWPSKTPAAPRKKTEESSSIIREHSSKDFNVALPEEGFAERFDGYGAASAKCQHGTTSIQGQRSTPYGDEERVNIQPLHSTPRLNVKLPATREHQTDEAIIALARDRYLKDHQMMTLRKRSSFFRPWRNKPRRGEKDVKDADGGSNEEVDTVGVPDIAGTGENITHISFGTRHLSNSQHSSSGSTKSRMLSASLKSLRKGWRDTFSRSSVKTANMPVQGVQSSTLHYGRDSGIQGKPLAASSEEENDVQGPGSIDQPPTPPPHLFDVRYSFEGTFDDPTLVNGHDEGFLNRSRVTSWNDSTRQSTLILPELDPMPSIQERPEPHRCDSGWEPRDDNSQADAPPVPLRRGSSHFGVRAMIDSHRLISATLRHHEIDQPKYRALDPRDSAISPSVYSERPHYGAMTSQLSSSPEVPETPPGTATVIASEAVSRWTLQDIGRDHRRSTSNDWRTWAADESSGLAGRTSFSIPDFVQPLADWRGSGDRTLATSRSSTIRKPMGSLVHSDGVLSVSQALTSETPAKLCATTIDHEARRPSTADPVFEARNSCQARSQDIYGVEKMLDKEVTYDEPSTTDLLSRNGEETSSLQSSTDDFFQKRNVMTQAESPYTRRRKPGRPLDENFLLRIRKGPYNASTNTISRIPRTSKESFTLPKRSSISSSIGTENTPPSKGQKMADEFLTHRKGTKIAELSDSSPAFL